MIKIKLEDLKPLLIHDVNNFTKEELSRRGKNHDFTQFQIVELFAWDFEVVAQLQTISDDMVLKGGTAAQLYILPQKQRGSVDVDLTCNLTKNEINNAVNTLTDKFKEFDPFFKFVSYKPKIPKLLLPLHTYFVETPSAIKEDQTCRIKVDILREDIPLLTIRMKSKKLFAIDIKHVSV